MRRTFREWLVDYEVVIGEIVIVAGAVAFTMAPVIW